MFLLPTQHHQRKEPNLDQPDGDQQSMAQGGNKCLWAIGVLAVLAFVLLLQFTQRPPRYYASILSISPIDSTTLEFNICVLIESRKPPWGQTCLAASTGVEVAYRGLPIAFAATAAEVCSGWWVEQGPKVVARTSMVGGLPSSVVDGLLADARRGVAVFVVTLRIKPDHDDGKLVTCVAGRSNNTRVTPCNVQYHYI
jgi:hypothetical protein